MRTLRCSTRFTSLINRRTKSHCNIRREFSLCLSTEFLSSRMGILLKESFPAGPREHPFRSEWAKSAGHSQDAAQEAEKTMMPTARKCYIVLRAPALLRKD